jgi:hypothetical protein
VSQKGGAAETGGANRCRGPNQGPPDSPMDRVSVAGPPQDLLSAVWADAEGRSGRLRRVGRQKLVVPNAAGAPTKAPPTVSWVV